MEVSPGLNAGSGLKLFKFSSTGEWVNVSPGLNAGSGLKLVLIVDGDGIATRISRPKRREWIETILSKMISRLH